MALGDHLGHPMASHLVLLPAKVEAWRAPRISLSAADAGGGLGLAHKQA